MVPRTMLIVCLASRQISSRQAPSRQARRANGRASGRVECCNEEYYEIRDGSAIGGCASGAKIKNTMLQHGAKQNKTLIRTLVLIPNFIEMH